MKKRLLYGLLLLFPIATIAQPVTRYYDGKWKETSAQNAVYYSVYKKQDSLWQRQNYYTSDGRLQMSGWYLDSACKKGHGKFTYYYSNGRPSSIGQQVNGKKEGTWYEFHNNGMMADSAFYVNDQPSGMTLSWYPSGYPSDSAFFDAAGNGTAVSWFDNGNPSSAGRYVDWKKQNGKWKYFHRNGQVSAIEIYDNGKLMEKQYFNEEGQPMDTTNRDQKATPQGGSAGWMAYISRQVVWPRGLQFTNTNKATVEITAWIDEEGNVLNAYVSKPLHREFDDIALSAMKRSPKWQPAISHNRKVGYEITQPITFEQRND
jgi:TonB family protein